MWTSGIVFGKGEVYNFLNKLKCKVMFLWYRDYSSLSSCQQINPTVRIHLYVTYKSLKLLQCLKIDLVLDNFWDSLGTWYISEEFRSLGSVSALLILILPHIYSCYTWETIKFLHMCRKSYYYLLIALKHFENLHGLTAKISLFNPTASRELLPWKQNLVLFTSRYVLFFWWMHTSIYLASRHRQNDSI